MTLTRPQQHAVFAALALLMLATRFHHFLPVPDLSKAIFFIGGFYLVGASRWAFPALVVLAMGIDWMATQKLGVSSYCLTPSYPFLVPAFAVLWYGGYWMSSRQHLGLKSVGFLAFAAFVAVSLSFTISNGAFYWLGGRYVSPNLPEYFARYAKYYSSFVSVPCLTIAIAAVLHTLLASVRGKAARNTT